MIHALVAVAMMRWAVVNDIHLDPFDTRPYVVSGADTNRFLFHSAVREMHRVAANAQVVVLGGDFLAHHFAALARAHHQNPYAVAAATMRTIAATLGRTFPHARFLIALGNNDDPCGDYRSETGGTYQRALAQAFAPLVMRDGAAPRFVHAFMRGGYYSVKLPNGERGVVLNSVTWSLFHRGGCQSYLPHAGRRELSWLRLTLPRGRSIVVMHIPPGYDPYATTDLHHVVPVPFLWGADNHELVSLLAANASRISFIVGAHTHRYDFRVPGGVPMLIASSISPVYRNNPAFYTLDVGPNGTLRNVTPYVYDLRSGVWSQRVSFDAMYGVHALTTRTLRAISEHIGNDPSVRRTWIAAYDVWSWRMGDIDGHRWQVFWCAQTHFESGYASCAGTRGRSRIAAVIVALGALAVVAAVLIAVLGRRRRRR
jgi:hypothetical protein